MAGMIFIVRGHLILSFKTQTADGLNTIGGSANLIFGNLIGEQLTINSEFFLGGLLGFLGVGVSLTAFICL